MKRTANYLCLVAIGCCLMTMGLASCGGSKSENDAQDIDEELSELVESGEFKENGLMKLRPAESVADTKAGYKVALFVWPDEALPRVPNDNFGTYCDNRASVIAFTEVDTLVSRQFSKADLPTPSTTISAPMPYSTISALCQLHPSLLPLRPLSACPTATSRHSSRSSSASTAASRCRRTQRPTTPLPTRKRWLTSKALG